jgi:hypothetical protein
VEGMMLYEKALRLVGKVEEKGQSCRNPCSQFCHRR